MSNKVLYTFNKYLYLFIFSLLSIFVLIVDYVVIEPAYLVDNNNNFFVELFNSIDRLGVLSIILFVFIFYFYSKTYFGAEKYNKKSLFCTCVAILFSIISIVSMSYSASNTLDNIYSSDVQVLKTIVFALGSYLIYYAILKKILGIKFDLLFLKYKNKFIQKMSEKTFKYSLIIIFLMWLPYIVLSFPGLATADTMDQLCQFFHLDTSWSAMSINLLDERVYINKHHSVLHTFIMGSIFKIGKNISSFTLGAFIYTVLQLILVLGIFAFVIKYMKRINVNSFIIFLSVLFIGLNPTIATYVLCAIKDTPNAIFNLLYVVFLLQIVRNFDSIYKSKIRIVGLLITILMVLMLRNNGIYTFVLSFPWLFLLYKKYWKKILATFLIPLLIFGLYDRMLLPGLGVSNGSIKETLSIPVMQIARVIRDKEEIFTDEDIKIIDNIFDFDVMKKVYDPNISDDVKNLYNKDATDEDMKLFFKVWFKYLIKEPLIYIESFINSTYGYFYPEFNRDELFLYSYRFYKEPYFDIENISAFNSIKRVFNNILNLYYRLPFFINKVAYYDWLLLFSCIYIIVKKKYKYLIPLTVLLAVLLSCLASPLNGSFRYILPIVFSVPMIFVIDYLVYKECKGCN